MPGDPDGVNRAVWPLWGGGRRNQRERERCPLCSVAARHCNLNKNYNLAFFCTHSIDACLICCSISISNRIISTSFSVGKVKVSLRGINKLLKKCGKHTYFASENSNQIFMHLQALGSVEWGWLLHFYKIKLIGLFTLDDTDLCIPKGRSARHKLVYPLKN